LQLPEIFSTSTSEDLLFPECPHECVETLLQSCSSNHRFAFLCLVLLQSVAEAVHLNYLISVLLGGRFNKIEQLLLWSDHPALASSAFKLVGDSIDLFSREV